MSCDIGEVTERLENEQSSLYLRHSSFSNPSVALPASQLILQPFHRFTYVTAHSPTLPLFHLHHSSFSNPSFAFPKSQALHLRHLATRPCMAEAFPLQLVTKSISKKDTQNILFFFSEDSLKTAFISLECP